MISDNYKKILTEIHDTSPFGKRVKMPKHLEKFIEKIKPTSIVDFGCGKGRLVESMQQCYPDKTVRGYDPGNTKFDIPIEGKYDLLMSTDVLEHVEPEFIDETLQYLSTKSHYIYHLIALSPAKLILPNGKNAHLILESKEWWRDKFVKLGYTIIQEDYMEHMKIPKGWKTALQIKKYFIMARKDGTT